MAVSYDYYRIFYHVVRCRSFTRAAEVLNNNQPNITRCMNNLEQELGCKLFTRSNRGVALTPEGERLYRRVSVAYEQLRLAEDEIRRDCSLDTGVISIAVSETALHLLLLDKLSVFHASYPGVRLRIANDSTPQAIEALKRGQVDCAVVTTPAPQAAVLQQTPLLSFHGVLLCGNRYPELTREPMHLSELSVYSFICLGEGTSTYEFYQQLFAQNGLPFRVDLEASTMDQVLPMISHNLGIGFYPEPMAADALARGEVQKISLIEEIPERHLCLIEDAARPQSVALRTLRKHLCAPAAASDISFSY